MGEKIIGLVQQQFIFLFQEMSRKINTSETPAYCFTVGVSVNQLISTGAIFSSKDLDLSVVQILTQQEYTLVRQTALLNAQQ